MSIQALNWALAADVRPPGAKLLLIVIANYANEHARAWPSKTTLAKDCNIDKTNICKHLSLLQDAGLLSIKERFDEGTQLTSLITLNLNSNSVTGGDDSVTGGGDEDVTRGVAQASQGGVTEASHKPPLRTTNEPPKVEKTPRGARLSTDWVLPDDWRQWARVNFAHASDEMVTLEADKFRDFWISKSGQAAAKLDWSATWRNWCRTAFAAKPSNQPINYGRASWEEQRAAKHEATRKMLRDLGHPMETVQ